MMNKNSTGDKTRELINAIGILTKEYNDVYAYNIETGEVTTLRATGLAIGVAEALEESSPGKALARGFEAYISNNVFPEDRDMMRHICTVESFVARLKNVDRFRIRYRISRDDGARYYYMMVARDDEFRNIIFAFAAEEDTVRTENIGPAPTLHSGNGKRNVIVVEDNKLNREILKEILSIEYNVLEAENGEEGYRILQENYRDISAVLLDLMMPVLDGFGFLEKVSKNIMLSSVPVIVLTAGYESSTEKRCTELGAVEFLSKPYYPDVVLSRVKSMIKLREADVTLRAIEYDELTGVYTRQAFYHYAEQLLRDRKDIRFNLYILDVENFKLVNSVYGESTGDSVIKYIARTLSEKLTSRDKSNSTIMARYGGDQFVCMEPSSRCSDAEEINAWIDMLKENAPVPRLVFKVGVYTHVDRNIPVSRICDRALSTLNAIKHNFSRNVAYFDGPLQHKRMREETMEARFEDAIEKGEFSVMLQPKYDCSTGIITGAEALVRWQTGSGECIPPDEFIDLFERDGLISRLDEYIFRAVCHMQKKSIEEGKKVLPVSINVSRNTIYNGAEIDAYCRIADETGISKDLVPLEITENAALLSRAIEAITKKLKEAGFTLVMDDFGSGYSSLTSLNILPFDSIKIDKSLTDFIGEKGGELIIRHTIELARELGMRVVAEGIETKQQLDFYIEQCCDEVQGYYYSKPVTIEEYIRMINA